MPSIQRNVSLAAYTTLQVGGPAEYFTTVATTAELAAAVAWAKAKQVPITILGGGSNVLVADAGISGLVIRIAGGDWYYETISPASVRVQVAAGASFDRVVADTVTRGYWGLENLSHIPGTVGATPVQNVGAYGVEVADLIESVTVFDTARAQLEQWPATDCDFQYRTSRFKRVDPGRYVVMAVSFLLHTTPQPRLDYGALQELQTVTDLTPQQVREAVIQIRSSKFPDWHRVGTAGSFFMNPSVSAAQAAALQTQYPELPAYPNSDGTVKLSLGWLLDHVCGLRGHRVGDVGLYDAQALVLVQYGKADAAAIDAFATSVAETVWQKTGIVIAREVTSWS